MDYSERVLLLKSVTSLFLLVFGCIVLFAAWFNFLLPYCDAASIWFQRSGSIIVLISVFSEVLALKAFVGFPEIGEVDARNKYKKLLSSTKILAPFLAIVGTVIWGYGDLIYINFK